MIDAVIVAPHGKMASLIVKEAAESDDIRIVGAVGPKGRDYIGKDVGVPAGLGYNVGAFVYDDIEDIIDDCDIVVDYSTVRLSEHIFEICAKHKKALLIGTTGLPEDMENRMMRAARDFPILEAANTSYMVNVMTKLLAIAANSLGDKCKIDILDMHDADKVDSPSGTAVEFAKAMSRATGMNKNSIECHSIRSGDIPSSHTVVFGGMGERLEITHHAYNWNCYAKGACEAIRFLCKRHKGFFGMDDVVAL